MCSPSLFPRWPHLHFRYRQAIRVFLLEIKVFLIGEDVLTDTGGTGWCRFHMSSSVAEERQTQLKGWAGVGRKGPAFLSTSTCFHHCVSYENSICRVFLKALLLPHSDRPSTPLAPLPRRLEILLSLTVV